MFADFDCVKLDTIRNIVTLCRISHNIVVAKKKTDHNKEPIARKQKK